jgi:pyruvate dehydrogenase E1 component alpha subunit
MATAARKAPATARAVTKTKGRADAKPSAAVPTAPKPADFSKDDELRAYRDMLLIRRFEEKAGQLYGMGFIGGFCHLYIGQEAVVVGLKMALIEGDQMITAYRDHGHMLAMDMSPRGVMAELTGRKGGYSRGKGGSMHMFSKEKNFYGGHGIVGAQVSLGDGARLRQQVSRQRQCLPDLFRRRRGQPGPGLRELQHGVAVEAAGHLCHREQSLCHGYVGRARSSAETDFSHRGAFLPTFPAFRSTAWTFAP